MTIYHLILIGSTVVSLLAPSECKAQQDQSHLFLQSAAASLERNFQDPEISWLLLDSSGQVVSQHWDDAQTPVAVGSLVKPFLVLAYAQQHQNVFPHVRCSGAAGHCWLPTGHGDIGLEESIAQSCNSYFLSLAKSVDRSRASALYEKYGLTGPSRESADEALIGLGGQGKESPMSLARAYLQLVAEKDEEVQHRILHGMELAAQRGTARGIDAVLKTHALAKTGTAACSHHPRAAADGFAIVLYPATDPRLLLLVRKHGTTGAKTATLAGEMLRGMGIGEAESATRQSEHPK